MATATIVVTVINYKPKKKEETKELLVSKKEDTKKEISSNETFKVDIKGEIINPGIYSLSSASRVIDQTCTIMIQKLRPLFARNPLISNGI